MSTFPPSNLHRVDRTGPDFALFAVALVVGCLATIKGEVTDETLTPFTIAAMIAIIGGEQMPTTMARRVVAPVTTATAMGLVMAPVGPKPTIATIVGIIWLTMLVGVLIAWMRGRPVVGSSMAARFLGIVATAYLARGAGDLTLVDWAFQPDTRHSFAAFAMFSIALLGSLVERLLEGLVVWLREGATLTAFGIHEVSSLYGIVGVTATAGPLIAVAQPVLDWVAIPLLLLPVLLTHLAVQRAIAIRLAVDESVYALSRLGEITGRSRQGHSRRVANLSVRIGQVMDLEPDELREVERTALLHDVGIVGLEEPIPGGATINVSTQVQEEIAAVGTRIVTSSPMLSPIAPALGRVRTPFRRTREFGERIPVAARIVRVANAWDDITEGTRTVRAREVALERLHLGLGYDYDPEVVAALEKTLP